MKRTPSDEDFELVPPASPDTPLASETGRVRWRDRRDGVSPQRRRPAAHAPAPPPRHQRESAAGRGVEAATAARAGGPDAPLPGAPPAHARRGHPLLRVVFAVRRAATFLIEGAAVATVRTRSHSSALVACARRGLATALDSATAGAHAAAAAARGGASWAAVAAGRARDAAARALRDDHARSVASLVLEAATAGLAAASLACLWRLVAATDKQQGKKGGGGRQVAAPPLLAPATPAAPTSSPAPDAAAAPVITWLVVQRTRWW